MSNIPNFTDVPFRPAMSRAEYRKLMAAKQKKPSKYRSKRIEVDGLKFDSQAEAKRWFELTLLQDAGHIRNLQRQVQFPIEINGVHICNYIADFVYFQDGKRVVEDKKGMRTYVYKLKKKLVAAVYNVTIKET